MANVAAAAAAAAAVAVAGGATAAFVIERVEVPLGRLPELRTMARNARWFRDRDANVSAVAGVVGVVVDDVDAVAADDDVAAVAAVGDAESS